MPTQGTNPNDDGGLYTTIIGPEGSQQLIMAESEDWVEDETAKIACDSPVSLAEWQ